MDPHDEQDREACQRLVEGALHIRQTAHALLSASELLSAAAERYGARSEPDPRGLVRRMGEVASLIDRLGSTHRELLSPAAKLGFAFVRGASTDPQLHAQQLVEVVGRLRR